MALPSSWDGVNIEHRTGEAPEEVAEEDRLEELVLRDEEEFDVPREGSTPSPIEATSIAAIITAASNPTWTPFPLDRSPPATSGSAERMVGGCKRGSSLINHCRPA